MGRVITAVATGFVAAMLGPVGSATIAAALLVARRKIGGGKHALR